MCRQRGMQDRGGHSLFRQAMICNSDCPNLDGGETKNNLPECRRIDSGGSGRLPEFLAA
jgi:hypothetical protein